MYLSHPKHLNSVSDFSIPQKTLGFKGFVQRLLGYTNWYKFFMGKVLVSKIKTLRESKGLSQRRLALALDVTENTISNWENGRTGLDWFERISKLCETLECSPNELFGYVEVTEMTAEDSQQL